MTIIAKDVSDAAANNLDFTTEEVYERRAYLKMELLKELLKNYISKDYQYRKMVSPTNEPDEIELEDEDTLAPQPTTTN